MPEYTQASLPIRIDTILEEDVLLLHGFSGTEGISKPFVFHLDLLSEDPAIDADELLRSPMSIGIELPDGEVRRIHGHVSQFVQLGRTDELTHYQAEMVPWLWFLSLSTDCRIFQEVDVLEIVEEIFGDLGYSDYDIRCIRNYPKREYCVQYRESHLDFISRLLEEEGIFYFFEHTDTGHVLVLADDNSSIQECPAAESVRIMEDAPPGEDVVHALRRKHSVHLGRVTLRDYDYLQPSLQLEASVSGEQWEESYDYPGRFDELDEGDRYTRLRLEESETLRRMVRGAGGCRGFQAGYRFELTNHYRDDANDSYALVEVRHEGRAGGYRSGEGEATHYSNEFLAIPLEVPFRPPRRSAKPTVRGTQSAEVVGPRGEEIWVDEHGRIKVQFHWDRRGQKDENSSCWIRVASTWAGKGWGFIEIPRIGQEVLVDFLEGDPDRPIVVGSVYNAEQTPPWGLPDSGTISGVKSRSSKGGGGYNEISLQDKKGSELINIHAQKDMVTKVLNDQTTTVGNDQTTTVEKGNQSVTVQEGNRSVHVSEGEIEESAKKQITGTSTTENVTFTAETFFCSQVASGKANVQGNKDGNVQVWGEQNAFIWSKQRAAIDSDDGPVEITAGTKVEVTADDEIKLSVGGASITITSTQIEITAAGSSVTLSSGGVSVEGSLVKLNS